MDQVLLHTTTVGQEAEIERAQAKCAPRSPQLGLPIAGRESSFFRFFQLPYLGRVFGTGFGVNKLQDIAIVADRQRNITLFLVGCPSSDVRKGIFRIIGYRSGELRDGSVEVAFIERGQSPLMGRRSRRGWC